MHLHCIAGYIEHQLAHHQPIPCHAQCIVHMHYSITSRVSCLYTNTFCVLLGVQVESIDCTQVHHLHKKYTTHLHMRFSLDRLHSALCTIMYFLLCPLHYAPHRCLALPRLELYLQMLNAIYHIRY